MRTWRSIFSLLALFVAAIPASAQILNTDAEYAVIMDHETGEILWSKDGDVPMIPASMTKMMTAYFVFDLILSYFFFDCFQLRSIVLISFLLRVPMQSLPSNFPFKLTASLAIIFKTL